MKPLTVKYSSRQRLFEYVGSDLYSTIDDPKLMKKKPKNLPHCSCRGANGTGHPMHLRPTIALKDGTCKHCEHYVVWTSFNNPLK